MNDIRIYIGLLILIIILFIAYPYFSVEEAYLGYYPDDNITPTRQELREWHELKLNESDCVGKEILNTIDVCGGHVTVFCKKRWSYAYYWTEIYCMSNEGNWQWWFK